MSGQGHRQRIETDGRPMKDERESAPTAPPKLLVLCAGDPDNPRTFSGSAGSLIAALERAGGVAHKANVLGVSDAFQAGPLPLRLLRRFDKFGLEERYRWSDRAFARNSARANRIGQGLGGYDACLMYGTNYLPNLPTPTYCYFDATFAQVYKEAAWEFRFLSRRQAERINAFQRQVYDHCTAIFPRTRWAGDSVIGDYGIASDKVMPAGAGPNYYAEALPHAPYDRQTILFLGVEFDRKGGPLLLEAFRRVRAALPQARLLIAGCSPPVDEERVTVLGFVPKNTPGGLQKMLELYASASVFCIMSSFEPFGIVVLEAQNSYVPCVVPRRFAFTETVQEGITGRTVPEYDAEVLSQTLIALLSDPARLETMGRAAHEYVRQEWTWDHAAARILDRVQRDLAPKAAR